MLIVLNIPDEFQILIEPKDVDANKSLFKAQRAWHSEVFPPTLIMCEFISNIFTEESFEQLANPNLSIKII